MSNTSSINENARDIELLIADFSSDNAKIRERARDKLTNMGSQAIADLTRTLRSPAKWVRWEAAKALADMELPEAAHSLVFAMEDRDFDVRWIASDGLTKLGRAGVTPLLKALIEHTDSFTLQQGAHHVLHHLLRGEQEKRSGAHYVISDINETDKAILEPLLLSLSEAGASVSAPGVAKNVLDALRRSGE